MNPFLKYGINNGEGESLALWRALVWAIARGQTRVGLPCYYRDEAAELLGREASDSTFVHWEYEVDLENAPFGDANKGFVPARACIPMRPAPTPWQLDHRGSAGLFELHTFDDLTKLERAVQFDASSEISVFGLVRRGIRDLAEALDAPSKPTLGDVLSGGDVFADLSITRDRFPSTHSYLSFASHSDLSTRLHSATALLEARWEAYLDVKDRLSTLEEFGEAVDALLAPIT